MDQYWQWSLLGSQHGDRQRSLLRGVRFRYAFGESEYSSPLRHPHDLTLRSSLLRMVNMGALHMLERRRGNNPQQIERPAFLFLEGVSRLSRPSMLTRHHSFLSFLFLSGHSRIFAKEAWGWLFGFRYGRTCLFRSPFSLGAEGLVVFIFFSSIIYNIRASPFPSSLEDEGFVCPIH